MAAITIEFNFRNQRFNDAARGLESFVDAVNANWDGSARVLSQELHDFLDAIAAGLATRHSQGWPGGTTTSTLSQRTGTLNEAILKSIHVEGQTFQTISGSIGAPGVPYASVQEEGATIRPRNAQYLAIPLPAALTTDGVPILPGPRSWPNTFVARSGAGNLIIFQKIGKGAIRPLYVLKTSVKIPPRLGMRQALNDGLPHFVERAMDAIVAAVIGGL